MAKIIFSAYNTTNWHNMVNWQTDKWQKNSGSLSDSHSNWDSALPSWAAQGGSFIGGANAKFVITGTQISMTKWDGGDTYHLNMEDWHTIINSSKWTTEATNASWGDIGPGKAIPEAMRKYICRCFLWVDNSMQYDDNLWTTMTWTATAFTVDGYSLAYGDAYPASGGGSGDPYITTLKGITYKMDDFTGTARMLQGMYQGKLLTINANTQLLNTSEIHELIEYRSANLKGRTFSENADFASFPAYFKKLFVSWGNEYFIIDTNTLSIEESNFSVEPVIEQKQVQNYEWSDKCSDAIQATILIGDIKLTVNAFSNKDIRNSFKVENVTGLTNQSGALVNTIFTKDMKRRSLRSVVPIKQREDRVSKKSIIEEHMDEVTNKKYTIKHDIF